MNEQMRAKFELELTRRLNGRFEDYYREFLRLLGDPPSAANVPQSFWDGIAEDLTPHIKAVVREVILAAASDLIKTSGRTIDTAIINQRAADYVSTYTFDLVKKINETSRQWLQESIRRYFTEQQTLGQLEENLMKIFSPERAARIAITEVTRANVQGDKLTVDQIEKESGVRMAAIFESSADEVVCDICGPLQGNVVSEESYPPLHPGCRCWLSWEVKE